MNYNKSKWLFLFTIPFFISVEIIFFFYTVFLNFNGINCFFKWFVYIYPFIIFYEGLYFYDKELNYAQIVKILLFLFIKNNCNCKFIFIFTLLVWLYLVVQYVLYYKQEYKVGVFWWQNQKKKGKDIYITFILNVLILFIVVFCLKENFQHIMTEEKIENVTSWVITFISTDLIFNFTAMFILLQENFNKYNSVFLLKSIVSWKTIILDSVVPGIMIVLLCLEVITSSYFLSFVIFCILYCLVCSVSLLRTFKKVLSDVELLCLLMSKTKKEMLCWYKTNQLTASKNNIDTILRITTNAIVNKQTDTLPDVLGIVLKWLDDKKDFISDKHHTAHSNNRFYYFLNVITDSLISVNSSIIVMLYAEQLFYIFQKELERNPFDNKEIDFKNKLKEMHLFYYSLYRLMSHYVNANEKEYDEVLLRLNGVYEFNVEENFLTLKPSERKGGHVFESDDYRDFEFFYFKFYEKLIDEAIKAENFRYLKRLFLFTSFYRLEDAELNTNHLNLLHKLTDIYQKILQACNYEDEMVFSVLGEYESLLHYFSYLRMDITLAEFMANVAYNSVKDIYIQLLKNKVHFTERYLKFLYEMFFEKSKKLCNSESYLNLFCYVVASYLDYTGIEKDKFAINQIWGRVEQLEELFTKRNQIGLLENLRDKKSEIVKKHPEVQTNYNKYRLILEKEIEEYKEVMRRFGDR